jgi:hypothetical protein
MRCLALILIALAAAFLTGCAARQHTHVEPSSFVFNANTDNALWRARNTDFVQIAKEHAREKKIAFDFQGTSAVLMICEERGALLARVEFSSGLGSQCLAVWIDPSGKVLRHGTGLVHDTILVAFHEAAVC